MKRTDLEMAGRMVQILAQKDGLCVHVDGPKMAAFIIWGAADRYPHEL